MGVCRLTQCQDEGSGLEKTRAVCSDLDVTDRVMERRGAARKRVLKGGMVKLREPYLGRFSRYARAYRSRGRIKRDVLERMEFAPIKVSEPRPLIRR